MTPINVDRYLLTGFPYFEVMFWLTAKQVSSGSKLFRMFIVPLLLRSFLGVATVDPDGGDIESRMSSMLCWRATGAYQHESRISTPSVMFGRSEGFWLISSMVLNVTSERWMPYVSRIWRGGVGKRNWLSINMARIYHLFRFKVIELKINVPTIWIECVVSKY